ncbi:ProQ/FINO family protein [Rosenbergiella epipactidis]|uniref:ProQ/FINO family protein n=1 Tax=Rosenbergiella epipactidis TaxID=1544694 RepID=UPI001F4E5326|nr:ProQ/FINO family protein [Rosenbergiella epipactidis]
MPLSEAKKQKQREAKALLEGFWGQAFKFSQPKPLKVGILEDMVEDAKARNLPFDLEIIKAALKLYVHRYLYQKAVRKSSERIGLNGQPAGEVTDEQKAYAKTQTKNLDAKQKWRKKASQPQNEAKPDVNQSDA